jgi:hypothetical protein
MEAPVRKGWRADPQRAAKIMKNVFPRKPDYDLVLTQLSESIDRAKSVAPKAWAVTLFPDGFRLNVGQVEVVTAFYDGVRLLLHGAVKRIDQELLKPSPYKVPGDNYIFKGSIEQFRRYHDVLLPAHHDFILAAGTTKTGRPRTGTPHRVSHSSGLVDLAESVAPMTGIEKAKRLFHKAGLAFPTIPEELAAQLRELGRWLFSTRPVDIWPYDLQDYVREVEETQVEDYALLCHSGHGVNSYALHYYLVHGSLHMFLQLGWGGIYMDGEAKAATIRDCFSMADRIVPAAQSTGRFQAGERLTIVASDFGGSFWLLPGEKLENWREKVRSNEGPSVVLTQALDWLTGHR